MRVVALTDRMTRLATTRHAPQRRLRDVVLRVLNRIPAIHHALAMNRSELAIDPTPRTR